MSKQEEKLERIYTVPLTRAWITARHKRTARAVRVLKEFAVKNMKSEEIKIDTELNERLWNRGITKPPRSITVKMEKDEDGVVTISLPKVEGPGEGKEKEELKALKDVKAITGEKEKALPAAPTEEALPAANAEGEKKPEEPAKTSAAPKKTAKAKKAAKRAVEKGKTDEESSS